MVADALSRKQVYMSALMMKELKLMEKLRDMNLWIQLHKDRIWCSQLMITNDFLEKIKVEQLGNAGLQNMVDLLGNDRVKDFSMGSDGILHFKNK